MKKILQAIQTECETLLLGEFTPREIARGSALGTLVAVLPTYGFAPFIVLILLSFFPRINKPAAFIALAVWNPIMQIPIYALSFAIGDWFYGGVPVIRYDFAVLNQVFTFTRRFLVGHLLMTTICTLIAYCVGYVAGNWYVKRLPPATTSEVTEA